MVLPDVSGTKFTEGHPKGLKICVTGAGGFIASHLAKRLKEEGHFVRGVDWKENEYMPEDMFCTEFRNLDLRNLDNCKAAVEGCDWVFNLAADMGAPPSLAPAARRPSRPPPAASFCAPPPTRAHPRPPAARVAQAGWASSSRTTRASSTTRP